jgi:HAD superfamily hydrolase (TIGR01450 family)
MEKQTIVDQFDTFLLDLDGVVYLGDSPLPGARRSLQRLRDRRKTLRFLTNDPRPARRDVVARLKGYEIDARTEEVVTCGAATAAYLRENGFESVYVLGSDGLCREMKQSGLRLARDDAEVVVVGCDERICYPDIRRASRLIYRGAKFVATNEDPTFPTPQGPAPATGTIVAAVRAASGREPVVVGKPNGAMFEAAIDGLDSETAIMIGDSLATDIAGARQQGLPAILVDYEGEIGLPSSENDSEEKARPDLVISSLADLFEATLSGNAS